jgi:cysteinyl-tRNA synthetase
MGECHLGEHFDIHGGGQDLQFPHHENEIAQSEAAHDCTFVNYWMHNGFVRVDDEKMSKSLGNFFTIRDVLKKYDAEVVRFFILRAHYRSPLNYSDKHLDDAKQALSRLYAALRGAEVVAKVDQNAASYQAFKDAMNDDFNTPEALAVLFELANTFNKTKDILVAQQLKGLANILGLLQRDSEVFMQAGATEDLDTSVIEAKIAARAEAKKTKNFAEADRIRQELLSQGVVLEDTAQGTIWRSN